MFVLCNNECLLMGNISVVSVQEVVEVGLQQR